MPDDPIHAVVSWREYMDARLGALEHATTLSRDALEKRLDSMNEIRQAMRDQAGTMITRAEYQIAHQMICDKVDMLRLDAAEIRGKASQSSVIIGYLISGVAILLTIVEFVRSLAFK